MTSEERRQKNLQKLQVFTLMDDQRAGVGSRFAPVGRLPNTRLYVGRSATSESGGTRMNGAVLDNPVFVGGGFSS